MKNIKLKIFAGLLILIVPAIFIGVSQYNKPHVDVMNKAADIVISSQNLIDEYGIDEIRADEKYVGKIIRIQGKISSISSSNEHLTIKTSGSEIGITCNVLPTENIKISKLKKGQSLVIKGICTGILLDIMMVKCVIVK